MKYLFTNGKIINGTREMQVQEGQVILVEDGKITGILPYEEDKISELKASGKRSICRGNTSCPD